VATKKTNKKASLRTHAIYFKCETWACSLKHNYCIVFQVGFIVLAFVIHNFLRRDANLFAPAAKIGIVQQKAYCPIMNVRELFDPTVEEALFYDVTASAPASVVVVSNCSEGQIRPYKVTEGRIMTLTQQWRYLKLTRAFISCERYRELWVNHFSPSLRSFERNVIADYF